MPGWTLAAAWITGCDGSGPPPKDHVDPPDPHTATPPVHSSEDTAPPPTVRELATAAGWRITDGTFTTGDVQDCCVPGVSCLWNNPSTPYVTYDLPPSPGQTAPDPGGEDGTSRSFRVRGDEALVWIGRTPPRALYWSIQTYLQYRPTPFGWKPILGSTGPSVNHLTFGAQRGGDPWDAPIVLVTTADQGVEDQVLAWLLEAGFSRGDIVLDHIPADLANVGIEPGSDAFGVVSRTAVFDDEVAGAAWIADTNAEVFRLTPPGDPAGPTQPHDRGQLPSRGTGTGEDAWVASVDALEAALIAMYPTMAPFLVESQSFDFRIYDCVDEVDGCSGNTQDRYYAKVPRFFLPDDGTFLAAFGVNHGRVGKASYSNVSANTIEGQIGLSSRETPDLVGSARLFLGADPLVDDLYVVLVARDCAAFPGAVCIEVPTGCPGVDTDEPMMVDFRAYLEPATGAAPVASELVKDRALHFSPN